MNDYKLLSDQVSSRDIEIVLRYLAKTLNSTQQGDVVEFGCYSGTMAINIQKYLSTSAINRQLWLYDSFDGLPTKHHFDQTPIGDNFQAGELAVSKNTLIKNFERQKLKIPIIKKAWFSELSSLDLPNSICFAFLDGDFYESILQSLKLVVPKIEKGGYILVHDFDRATLPGVRRALQDFYRTKDFIVENNIAIIKS